MRYSSRERKHRRKMKIAIVSYLLGVVTGIVLMALMQIQKK